MTNRRLIALPALAVAMVLSASTAAAAPTAKVDRAITVTGCDHPAAKAEERAVKPDKAKHQDRGKHLGQTKPKQNENAAGDHERKQNHGWFVSQVAKDHSLTGQAHGKAVSDAARGDEGKPDKP